MIKENLEEVEARITRACERSGRERSEVTLISVSKTKPAEMLQEAYDAGSRDFGENKPQEIREKYPQLPTDIRWHMIGHLQRNKIKYIIDKVCMIHSVDSIRLAEAIDEEAKKHGIIMPVPHTADIPHRDNSGNSFRALFPPAPEAPDRPCPAHSQSYSCQADHNSAPP